ncbi:MAG: hypothetical protein AB1489_26600 [Acidobacteriota bacterium]
MQAILCARCQSQNPRYTKFCLTCGSAITPPVTRETPVQAVTKSVEEASSSQQEGKTWLQGLKRLWIF